MGESGVGLGDDAGAGIRVDGAGIARYLRYRSARQLVPLALPVAGGAKERPGRAFLVACAPSRLTSRGRLEPVAISILGCHRKPLILVPEGWQS
ncbi:MAG: hypothetical protein QOI59_5901, partial [Gammaproteobacteria bacterium]|nr:hypothetical protein [Gammaproteobacteria bacterium]